MGRKDALIRELSMRIGRRKLVSVGVGSALFIGMSFVAWRVGIVEEMFGETDLMRAGPLGEQAIGRFDAPVTIIEYASMTCLHCAAFASETFPLLKTRYIDTGKVRFVFREFPLDRLANAASMLVRCAGEGRVFSTADLLFQSQRSWLVEQPLEPLLAAAKQAGFTDDSFKSCLADQTIFDGIQWTRDRALDKFKVTSTPTFFINGKKHVGNLSIDDIERLIIKPSVGGR